MKTSSGAVYALQLVKEALFKAIVDIERRTKQENSNK